MVDIRVVKRRNERVLKFRRITAYSIIIYTMVDALIQQALQYHQILTPTVHPCITSIKLIVRINYVMDEVRHATIALVNSRIMSEYVKPFVA